MIGIAIGFLLFLGTLWIVNMIAEGPPPEPDPDAVHEVAVDYRCGVCGMRLTVTMAQESAADPPRHCREEMTPL